MYKVLFDLDVLEYLSEYFKLYREYYENLYKDSWIWSEEEIINWYINESIQRRKEIIEIIEKKLSEETVLGKKLDNIIILKWRSKYILIKWFEYIKTNERYISSIEIR